MKTLINSDVQEPARLFSNLEITNDGLYHQPGSVLGSTALVAGTTIGAGILALPAVTLPSGVVPSTVLLIAVWLYTLVSGLLIAEVNLNAMRQGRASNGFLAMVESTLGKPGARLAGGAYLFLHYALLVAYIAQGGEILLSVVQADLPAWVGTTAFALLFGGIMYFGRQKFVEKLNSALLVVVIASFAGLLLLAGKQVHVSQFVFQNWSALPQAVSVMLVALFYHNVIPVITTQLEGDQSKVRHSIFIGSLIPLIMFLAWNAVILGSVSIEGTREFTDSKNLFDPLQALRYGGGGEWLGVLVSVFSEFAIVTSFIGFVYGLLDFFKDVINSTARASVYSLILFPPMSLSVLNPSIFVSALDYAGTFSISVLGGIIPALMVWRQRREHKSFNYPHYELVPGGNAMLVFVVGVAVAIIVKEIL